MKAQRRRFVVEVKRGTSRASFISQDAAADRFGSAEDALFGPRRMPAATAVAAPAADVGAARPLVGRILPDLHEPAPPPLPDVPPPARRGRKPGSKNKPKPVLVEAAPHGRGAGSTADAPPRRSAWPVPESAPEPHLRPVATERSELPQGPGSALTGERVAVRRSRLRDRSAIFKRYVLGTEPAPGQPGWMRAKRAKRAKRRG